MAFKIITAEQMLPMPWKNGGGLTREIARFPEHGEWVWRMSVAEVDADGPFSAFPGCMRSLTLLSGEGMSLDFPDRSVPLLPPHGSLVFSGDEPLTARLLNGPTTDFNAIWRTDSVSVSVERRAMHGVLWCIPEPGVSWLVYFHAGRGEVKSDPDNPAIRIGDAVWLAPSAGEPRLVLEAYGEALWVRITAI
jgi:environmental stress-induced protein Ves